MTVLYREDYNYRGVLFQSVLIIEVSLYCNECYFYHRDEEGLSKPRNQWTPEIIRP